MKKFFLLGFIFMAVACQPAIAISAPESTPTSTPLPAFSTATATETLVPTSTFSPTPSPRFFTENFDSDIPDWSIIHTSGAVSLQFQPKDGFLSFELDSPYTWTYALYRAHDYSNVRIDMSVENHEASPVAIGLVCDYSETNGWYEFNISTDGTYNVLFGRFMAEGIASYTPIVKDTSEYLRPGETTYELGLACTQNTLWLYINQKLFRKIDVTRYGLTEGKVGLAVASFENTPVTTSFDWVNVSKP
jgi:hypothetical protein